MPIDKFSTYAGGPGLPATSIIDITPSDVIDLSYVTVALNVATPGRIRVTTLDGDTSDVSVAPGAAFPLRVSRVWMTGTTATGIRGLI